MNIVSDTSANAEEKIERAAKVLRASPQNKEVFKIIYSGGKSKTLEDIKKKIKKFNTNTYKAAARLHSEDIIDKKTIKSVISYGKIHFYSSHRDRVLKLSENAKRLKEYPTKRKHSTQIITKTYSFRTRPQAELLLIDNIDSFKAVRQIQSADTKGLTTMPERKANRAICTIINQSEKKDWGGERNDIHSNNLLFKGKRKPAAFALKGRATKGILTLNKMGKKADQIQRLFEGTAEIHFVVYHSDIDERVLDQMQAQAINKSVATGKKIYYCPIDGKDLARLRTAYPTAFN
jgi:predicted transcriptional regulator